MSNQELVVIIAVLSVVVAASVYLSTRVASKKNTPHPLIRGLATRGEIDLIYGPQLDRMRDEMEASKQDCAKRIEELERRVEFLLSVIMASEKPLNIKSSASQRGLVLVMSTESIYASAVKVSGIPVSIVDQTDLTAALAMIPRDNVRGDYGVVLAVVDDWSDHTGDRISRVGDVSNRVFVLFGRDSDRIAAFVGPRSRGAVAVNATALMSAVDEKTGGTRRDSVVEGNIAAFCAAFVSGVVKDGVSIDRAYEQAKSAASGWVADRTRLHQ